MTWTLAGRPLKSILVTRLRYLGDVVMSTVVLEVLRKGDPDLHLGYLCEAGFGAVLTGHPYLDRIHLLDAGRRSADARARCPGPSPHGTARGTLRTLRDLRRVNYDLAIDLFFNPRSSWLLKLSGIPLRIGGTAKLRRRLFTHTVVRPEDVEPSGWRDLVTGGLQDHLCRLAPLRHEPGGQPFLQWLEDAFLSGELLPQVTTPALGPRETRLLRDLEVGAEKPYLVLAPGATWPTKEWPAEAWGNLIERLQREMDLPLLVILPPGDPRAWARLSAHFADGFGGVLPPISLPGVLGVVGGAVGMVTVDGGVMHASVAMGVPTLALFGPTDPDIWFPYSRREGCAVMATRPHCHPCDLHECGEFICLPGLDPKDVAEHVSGWFAGGG